jgi:hypothetical protein
MSPLRIDGACGNFSLRALVPITGRFRPVGQEAGIAAEPPAEAERAMFESCAF